MMIRDSWLGNSPMSIAVTKTSLLIISNMGKEIYYNLSQNIEQTNKNILQLKDELNYNSAQNNNILTKKDIYQERQPHNKIENLSKNRKGSIILYHIAYKVL